MFNKIGKLWGETKRVWNETRGGILRDQLSETMTLLSKSDERILEDFHRWLYSTYTALRDDLYKMSVDGQVSFAKKLQDEARKTIDFDLGKSYAMWIAGAWLESKHLPGDHAKNVHEYLDKFLSEMVLKFHTEKSDTEPSMPRKPTPNMEAALLVAKKLVNMIEPARAESQSPSLRTPSAGAGLPKMTNMTTDNDETGNKAPLIFISLQLGMANVELDAFGGLLHSHKFALAYASGAVDAFAQSLHGHSKESSMKSIVLLIDLFMTFMSREAAGDLVKRVMVLQKDSSFMNDMAIGGQEMINFSHELHQDTASSEQGHLKGLSLTRYLLLEINGDVGA